MFFFRIFLKNGLAADRITLWASMVSSSQAMDTSRKSLSFLKSFTVSDRLEVKSPHIKL